MTQREKAPDSSRDGASRPPRPASLGPILGAAPWPDDLRDRRWIVRKLGHWALRCGDPEVRAAGELLLDVSADGQWQRIADQLGVQKGRGGPSDRQRTAIEQRNILLRRIRFQIGASELPPPDAARKVIEAVKNYEMRGAWHRQRKLETAPAGQLDALCWNLLGLNLKKRLPRRRQLALILERSGMHAGEFH